MHKICYFIILLFISCAHFQEYKKRPIEVINLKSLVLTGYGSGSYTEKNVISYLDELSQLNANTASFLYTCYIKDQTSSKINCNTYDSPSLQELSLAIDLAKKRGFIVNLRFYIDLENNEWRCLWDPKDYQLTFKNLDHHMKVLAQFAEKRKLELFIIGAEYCHLTKKKYTKHWNKIIDTIRSNFKGKITYGANWGPVNGVTEYQNIMFWDKLDYIGIDHYMPIPDKLTNSKIFNLQKKQFEKYIQFSKSFEKPILITEVGFPGYQYGNLKPFEWRNIGKSSESRQALLYKNTLKATKEFPQIKGVFIWRKLASEQQDMKLYQKNELGYNLYKRKAWYDIQEFFTLY